MRQALVGTPAAPGIAIGPVWRYSPPAASTSASTTGPGLEQASALAAAELRDLARRIRDLGRDHEAEIFEAQTLMASDAALLDEAAARIADGEEPSAAVLAAGEALASTLAALDDELLAARAADVRDVAARVARILAGTAPLLPAAPSIAVAADLPASLTVEIPAGMLLGIALATGSRTSHAAILARSLGIPAVTGVVGLPVSFDGDATHGPEGHGAAPQMALIDGDAGTVVLDPDADEAASASHAATTAASARTTASGPAFLASGEPIHLLANIASPSDAARAIAAGAEGIGLFRTEFLFMRRLHPPTEAEQVAAYREVFRACGARPVVVRLADIGGDKKLPYLDLPHEQNPFLGVRGLRLAYADPALLTTQIRAISQAGGLEGVVPSLMAPMVSTVEDVQLLHRLVDRAKASLASESKPRADTIRVGIMVEVPAAALLARRLAGLVAFFSIGTNDLVQYVMAADRTTAQLERLQDPLHPAVLALIAECVEAARAASIDVAVCGEAAGDPVAALVLVALGVSELSMGVGSLPAVRAALGSVTAAQLDRLAAAALSAAGAQSVRDRAAALLTPHPNSAP